MGPKQVLILQVRGYLGAMAMTKYPTFLKAQRHQMILCLKQDTRWGEGLNPLQRCSRLIIPLQQTGLPNSDTMTSVKYWRIKLNTWINYGGNLLKVITLLLIR